MNNNELGKKAKSKITGFEGTITGKCYYLTGCTQVLIAPPVDDNGNHREAYWFDLGSVDVYGEEVGIRPEDVKGEEDGGPQRYEPKCN